MSCSISLYHTVFTWERSLKFLCVWCAYVIFFRDENLLVAKKQIQLRPIFLLLFFNSPCPLIDKCLNRRN